MVTNKHTTTKDFTEPIIVTFICLITAAFECSRDFQMSSTKKKESKPEVKTKQKKSKAVDVSQNKQEFTIWLGPQKMTRFEKARILGARSLQLSMGAPAFIPIPPEVTDPISLAKLEIDQKVLPISIRRILPNAEYQDIPLDRLMQPS